MNTPTRLFKFNDLVTEGLVAVYNLENVNDSFGTNNLTANGGATFGTGKILNGVVLDGVNDFLSIADNAALSFGNNVYASFVGWFKLDTLPSAGNTATILSKWQGTGAGNAEYLIDVDEDGRLRFLISSTGSNSFINETNINAILPNTWYFFSCWQDGDNTYIELNADGNIFSFTAAGFIFNGTSQFRIGARHEVGNNFLDGIVDAVRVYKHTNRVITALERTALFNLGVGLQYAVNTTGSASEINQELDQIIKLFNGTTKDITPKLAIDSALTALTINQNGSATIAQYVDSGNLLVEINNTGQLKSTVPTGTAPFVISSNTRVDNLNVGLLDGFTSAEILQTTSTITLSINAIFINPTLSTRLLIAAGAAGFVLTKLKIQNNATASSDAATTIQIKLDKTSETVIGSATITGNSAVVVSSNLNYTFTDVDNGRVIAEITTYSGTTKHNNITVDLELLYVPA